MRRRLECLAGLLTYQSTSEMSTSICTALMYCKVPGPKLVTRQGNRQIIRGMWSVRNSSGTTRNMTAKLTWIFLVRAVIMILESLE